MKKSQSHASHPAFHTLLAKPANDAYYRGSGPLKCNQRRERRGKHRGRPELHGVDSERERVTMYRRFVVVGVAVVLSLGASTVLAQCDCGPAVATYAPVAPSYTAYYAPTPYVTYYAPRPYVAYYPTVRPHVTYYAPVVRPYAAYYRVPRRAVYWGW